MHPLFSLGGVHKECCYEYVCYVVSRGLRLRDLAPNFLTLALLPSIQQFHQTSFASLHASITEDVNSQLSERFNIDCERVISTRSNLNSVVLREILQFVGIESNRYATKNLILDERLLKNRNRISHGESFYLDIESVDYISLHETIVNLLQQFRTDLENAAAQQKFRNDRMWWTPQLGQRRGQVKRDSRWKV